MAGLSDVAVVVQPGRAWRVVLVCHCRGCQWSARAGLCGGPYGPGWPHMVAVGCLLRHSLPVVSVLSWFTRLWRVRVGGCCVVASTLFGWPSSSLPNGWPVLLSVSLGRGGRVGSVPIVPVASGRHGTLWRCVGPSSTTST